MAHTNNTTSMYKKTEVKEFYLDIWNADSLSYLPTVDDVEYKIPSTYDRRPDLLAYELYGTADLWYIFALRNKDLLFDPIADFAAGLTIWLPDTNKIVGGI